MYLFDVILKLIKTLALVDSEKYMQLKADVDTWVETKKEDDKLWSLYNKIHSGVWLRLLCPFLYFYLLGWVKNLQNPDEGDFLNERL